MNQVKSKIYAKHVERKVLHHAKRDIPGIIRRCYEITYNGVQMAMLTTGTCGTCGKFVYDMIDLNKLHYGCEHHPIMQ